MFKDYYLILEVSYDASAADIKSAYRAKSMRWHPDRNPDRDVTHVMQEINEAYAILGDAEKRQRYDLEYLRYRATSDAWKVDEFVVQDEAVAEDIKQARQSAQELVAEFMKSFKHTAKTAAKGAGEVSRGYVFALIVMFVLGLLVVPYWKQEMTETDTDISASYREPAPALVTTEEPPSPSSNVASTAAAWQTPTSWKRYELGNGACSIAVPNSVKSDPSYTKQLKTESAAYGVNADFAVFQRQGVVLGESYEDYCFITVVYIAGKAGEFLSAQETDPIDQNTKAALRNMIQQELHPYRVIGEPTCRWIDLQGIKALEVKYRGKDQENIMVGTMYYLNNYSEMVRVAILYSANAKSSLSADWNNVIRTFRWE